MGSGLVRKHSAVAALACVLAGLGGLYALVFLAQSDLRPATTGGASSIDRAEPQADALVADLLNRIYIAYALTDEGSIYGGLAEVAAGDALAALYLQRRAAFDRSGLDPSTQQIHGLELVKHAVRREGVALLVEARWRVIGTIGHETHRHVRGNEYAAEFRLEASDGRWRATGFALTDVDRSLAGTMVEAPVE